MSKGLKKIVSSNIFHKIMISVIILTIMIITGLVILRYEVEGEYTMPYEIEKISIISSSEGTWIDDSEYKWSYDVSQINDIYIYINENEEKNTKLNVIEEIEITDIQVKALHENDQKFEIYKPDEENNIKTFLNEEDNIVTDLIFYGDYENEIQNMKVGYQGGMIGFRCSNTSVGVVESDEEEIDHLKFLEIAKVEDENLAATVIFTLKIKLKEGVTYVGEIEIEIPVEGVTEDGITSIEKTNIDNTIFKREK